jgi:hypothetical protein
MPRVKTTPMVKIALYGLLIYLAVLLSLITVKFVRTFTAHGATRTAATATMPAAPSTISAPAAP